MGDEHKVAGINIIQYFKQLIAYFCQQNYKGTTHI